MGYPINNYSLFKEIASGDKHGHVKSFFNDDFSLYGFIVHDSKRDKQFNEVLEESFFSLNLTTGDDFLFTSFCDPPEAWLDWARMNGRDYGQYFWDPKELRNPNLVIKTFNPSLVSLFISQYLGINDKYPTYIILSPNLKEKCFYFLPLNYMDLLDIMTKLTEVAYYLKNGKKWEDVIDAQNKIELRKIELEESLAETLHKLSQTLIYFSTNYRKLNISRVTEALNSNDDNKTLSSNEELNLFYEGMKMFVDNGDHNQINYNQSYAVAESRRNYPSRAGSIESLQNFRYLEHTTQLFLKQGESLLDFYQESYPDASPFILPFVKALELELSYSIVHWVRKNYDINLPEYFYEYEPRKNVMINIGRGSGINFNLSWNQQWRSPELGGQILGFKTVRSNSKNHPFETDNQFNRFIDLCYIIKNIRNRACHPNFTSEKELLKVIDSWIELLKGNYFEILNLLKSEYKGV